METKQEIRERDKLRRFKMLSGRFPSMIPIVGKKAIETNWNRYCEEPRPFNLKEFRNYNAGLPGGPANGTIYLDVDDYEKTEKYLEEREWETPPTFTVRTGRAEKAIHLYYGYPDDGKVYGNYSQPDPDNPNDRKKSIFQIKGFGGYVVAPGSIHPITGNTYKILRDLPIAPAPQWLLDLTEKKSVIKESPKDIKPAPNDLVGNFLSKLEGVESRGPNQWIALCPAHDDHDPSLSIGVGEDGKILVHCFAGCLPEQIIQAVGMNWKEFFPTPAGQARAVLNAVKSSNNLEDVLNSVHIFAGLDANDFALLKNELKKLFEKELNLNDFTKAVNEAKARGKSDGNPDFAVIVTKDRPLRDISSDALDALYKANNPPKLFVRGGALARLRTDEHQRPLIDLLNESHLRGELTRTADFIRDQGKHVDPTKNLVMDVLSLPDWDFPPLEGIVEGPVLRPDGTILYTPGYDEITGLYYYSDNSLIMPPIPDSPNQAMAKQALDLIMSEVFVDFPFVDDASRANAVALLITPIVRPFIRGLTPMGTLDSPDKGTGKGLFADVTALIATGKPADSSPVPSGEEEWRKKITSILMEGFPIVSLDNVDHPLNSSSLASALTAEVWVDRILGISKMVRVKNRATWMVNGNNIKVVGDLIRRCYWIRMDAKTPTPWKRTNFRHKKLKKWVRNHRAELLAALLTIIRAWFVAGRPKEKGLSFGSFEEWVETVGGILHYVGIPGFLANQDKFYETTDEDRQQWKGFLAKLRERYQTMRFTAQELAEELRKSHSLRSFLPDSLGGTFHDPKKSFERSLGKALAQNEGVRHDFGSFDMYLKRVGKKGHAVIWRVNKKLKEESSQPSE